MTAPSTRLTFASASVSLAQGWRRFIAGMRVFFRALYETPPGC